MRYILIYDGKNMDLEDWLLQIKNSCTDKKSRVQTGNSKSNSTTYKIMKIMGNDLRWQDI